MSELKATPGPYTIRRTNWYTIQVMTGEEGNRVGICEASAFDTESEANAHLLAASWDLYHALDGLVKICRPMREEWLNEASFVDAERDYRNALAALAKARGEQ